MQKGSPPISQLLPRTDHEIGFNGSDFFSTTNELAWAATFRLVTVCLFLIWHTDYGEVEMRWDFLVAQYLAVAMSIISKASQAPGNSTQSYATPLRSFGMFLLSL